MPGHNIIAIGASAGGVEALKEIVATLPDDLDAAVFIVVHIPPTGPSLLAQILDRRTRLTCVTATNGLPIHRGTIYVAPPDYHVEVQDGRVRLDHGPKENGHRPSVDALFRSAARSYGNQVIAVVLTGNLDDGTVGMRAVKQRGGLAVAQDPADASYPGMPRSAVLYGGADFITPLDEMGRLLTELTRLPAGDTSAAVGHPVRMSRELHMPNPPQPDGAPGEDRPPDAPPSENVMREDDHGNAPQQIERPASGYTCPECHGALWDLRDGDLVRYRCRVGHTFTEENLLLEQDRALEAALWSALVALEERCSFVEGMARRARVHGNDQRADRLTEQANDLRERSGTIRNLLRSRPSPFETSES